MQKPNIVFDTSTSTGIKQEQQHIREENQSSFGRVQPEKMCNEWKTIIQNPADALQT